MTVSPGDAPFDILAFGDYPPNAVTVRHDAAPRTTCDALERLIADEWNRRTAAAEREGRLLFNGEQFRYVAHEVCDGRLTLTVGPTCYRDFVGTNLFNPHRLDEFGWAAFANPVGTTATLHTADDCLVFGRRSGRVAYHGGHLHTFGGALEPGDRAPDGAIDSFASVKRELGEELGLKPDELEPLRCVGLIRDREIFQPEMLFEARIPLSLADLLTRWSRAEAADEHAGLAVVRTDPSLVVPFLRDRRPVATVAAGALLLFGRAAWGEAWFNQTADELAAGPG